MSAGDRSGADLDPSTLAATSYKQHFTRFLARRGPPGGGAGSPGGGTCLHFAAHSHHLWPDVSFEAHERAWLDAADLADHKWERVFGEIVPAAQAHVARVLGLPDPRTIVFAPNTHELLVRLHSCLPAPARILTSDGEFHSFTRQGLRWEEAGAAIVDRVPVEPMASFGERFLAQAASGGYDMVLVSQVFFNSGFVWDGWDRIAATLPEGRRPHTLIVVDGYHGFMALPTDLGAVADRIFYLAGGYKYAMSGEGACFMHCPPGFGARPANTGWFAGFGDLEKGVAAVPYPRDGMRFSGSTFDPSGLYRMVAVLGWVDGLGLSVAAIHARARVLEERFLAGVDGTGVPGLSAADLIPPRGVADRGNFLTFCTPRAEAICRDLSRRGITVDHRGDRLRVGFGIYQDPGDVDALLEQLRNLARAA